MPNKTVWIINQGAQPPSQGSITRHHMISKELNALGYDATVIASNFGVHSRKHFVDINEGDFLKQEIEWAKFCWVRSPSFSNNLLSMTRNIFDFSYRILGLKKNGLLTKPDIIIGSSPQLLPSYAALRLAKSFNVPFIFEIRDLIPQHTIENRGLHPLHPAVVVMRLLEYLLYKKSDHIVSTLPYADQYIVKKCSNHPPVTWISNMVDMEKVPKSPPTQNKEVFEVLYAGSMGKLNHLYPLLDAAFILQKKYHQSIIIKLMGDGAEKSNLQNYASHLGLKNTTFPSKVKKEDVFTIMQNASTLFISIRNIPLYQWGVSPNKLFDYMASSCPVIEAADLTYSPISEARCGFKAMPDDPESIALAIEKLYKTPLEERIAMGERGYEYIKQHHCSKVLTSKYAKTINDVLEGKVK